MAAATRSAPLLAVGPLGQDRQVGDRQYRALQGEGQALDHADGDAHAGEGARTAPEGDGVHRGQGDAGLVEQVADHRQQALGVQARDHLVVTERPPSWSRATEQASVEVSRANRVDIDGSAW